jgi:hypothetical protein
MSDYIAMQASAFEALQSQSIESWHGVEMFLYEDEDGVEIFEDERVPCLQMHWLVLTLGDGSQRVVSTYQDDSVFGLRIRAAVPAAASDPQITDGFRYRTLPQLPAGEVSTALPVIEDGQLVEFRLTIGGALLLLIAGEIQPTWTERLEFHRFDESVLVFLDPDAADALAWIPERPARGSPRGG